MSTATATELGANSEVGTLRTVIVHRPDLAHERLSPTNCHELLFDDVIWVRRARQEFDAFVDVMRAEGVEVLLFHELLTDTLADAEARDWVLSRRLRPEDVTEMFSKELTAWMKEMPEVPFFRLSVTSLMVSPMDETMPMPVITTRRSSGRKSGTRTSVMAIAQLPDAHRGHLRNPSEAYAYCLIIPTFRSDAS